MIDILGIGELISSIGKVADDLFTSDKERLTIALQAKALEADLVKGQMDIDKTEAQNPSVFVAGWRPFIGWVGGLALAYKFLLYPFMLWGWTSFQGFGWIPHTLNPPPVLDAQELWPIITGMLGIAGLRSFDKLQGTQTDQVGNDKPSSDN
jgi:hypothetical protein